MAITEILSMSPLKLPSVFKNRTVKQTPADRDHIQALRQEWDDQSGFGLLKLASIVEILDRHICFMYLQIKNKTFFCIPRRRIKEATKKTTHTHSCHCCHFHCACIFFLFALISNCRVPLYPSLFSNSALCAAPSHCCPV